MSTGIITGSESFPAGARSVLTIGNFDGVHLGHRALVARLAAEARREEALAVVLTFDPAPRDVLRPGNGVQRIQRTADRVADLLGAGADRVVIEPFTLEYAKMDALSFARTVLEARLRPAALVLGFDFRFGRGRGGTATDLREILQIPVHEFGAIELEGAPVSSSRIRGLLTEGQVAPAARLLGRPHAISGEVIHGDARGRTIGFPTANLRAGTELVPAHGVYAVRVDTGGGVFGGVANVGTRPTFGPGAVGIEAHLFDFQGDLYGKTVKVAFVDRIRDEQRFSSLDALVAQIGADALTARGLLGGSP